MVRHRRQRRAPLSGRAGRRSRSTGRSAPTPSTPPATAATSASCPPTTTRRPTPTTPPGRSRASTARPATARPRSTCAMPSRAQGTAAPTQISRSSAPRKFTLSKHNDAAPPATPRCGRSPPASHAGRRFFDHFDLVTLENPDFYPDGRDLGENYTYTSWRMSPCVKAGKLDCIHCHTSSGRYRFRRGGGQRRLPALPRGAGGQGGGAHPSPAGQSSGGQPAASPATCR